jgi:putative transposase
VDTLGLLWAVVVHAASLQDPAGAKLVLENVKGLLPRLRIIWADGIYESVAAWVLEQLSVVLEIVSKRPGATSFEVLPHRWIVERTFGWFGRYRRLSKDYEFHPATSEAMLLLAMTNLMVRRLARMRAL